MTLDPATVLVTGATDGLGRALALCYARPGRTLVLHGRDADRLEAIRGECAARGAVTHALLADLRDTEAFIARLQAAQRATPIDLALVNAAVTLVDDGAGEAWPDIAALLEVNVVAALATAATVAADMRARGRGHIALVSSLAAFHGMAVTPAYSASKAALKAYGEALRGALAPHGVRVSVVMPGFIRTPMSDRFPAAKPFLLEPDDAARRIARGLSRGQARIAFPQPLAFGAWLLGALPASWSARISRSLGY